MVVEHTGVFYFNVQLLRQNVWIFGKSNKNNILKISKVYGHYSTSVFLEDDGNKTSTNLKRGYRKSTFNTKTFTNDHENNATKIFSFQK